MVNRVGWQSRWRCRKGKSRVVNWTLKVPFRRRPSLDASLNKLEERLRFVLPEFGLQFLLEFQDRWHSILLKEISSINTPRAGQRGKVERL
jgi:hypothetical protein